MGKKRNGHTENGREGKDMKHYPTNHPVNHPKQYISNPSGVECIEITRHMNFNRGNAIKYIWRAENRKDINIEIQDLEKAIWYLKDEIERVRALTIRDTSTLPPAAPTSLGPAAPPPPSAKIMSIRDMTDEQLADEWHKWNEKIANATSWGAALAAADVFRKQCESEIKKRGMTVWF